jgi:hypothetical protein
MADFWNASTSTYSAPPTRADADMVMEMRALIERNAREDQERADKLRDLARTHGFDLDAGDVMILPKGVGPVHIPDCFAGGAVRVSPLADAVYFIHRHLVDPSFFPRR